MLAELLAKHPGHLPLLLEGLARAEADVLKKPDSTDAEATAKRPAQLEAVSDAAERCGAAVYLVAVAVAASPWPLTGVPLPPGC